MKKIETFTKSILLNILLMLRHPYRTNENISTDQKFKILVIRLNRIGDALVTTPLISYLKNNLNCEITVLADRKNHFIFKKSLGADKVIIFRKGIVSFFKLIKEINSLHFDIIVDAHDDVSTTCTYLVAFSEAKYKVGLLKDNSKIFTHTIERANPAKVHIVLRIMNLVKLLGLDFNPEKINITYHASKESEIFVEKFLTEKFQNKKFIVGINISAGSEARFWGKDRFKKLIKFFESYDVNILLLSSGSDLDKIKDLRNSRLINFYSNDFDKFTAIIAKLDLLITPDTSVVHLASAYKVPVFGLYVKYNTEDMIWSPFKSEFDCVITEEPTLINMNYETVINKLKPFFERLSNAKRNS